MRVCNAGNDSREAVSERLLRPSSGGGIVCNIMPKHIYRGALNHHRNNGLTLYVAGVRRGIMSRHEQWQASAQRPCRMMVASEKRCRKCGGGGGERAAGHAGARKECRGPAAIKRCLAASAISWQRRYQPWRLSVMAKTLGAWRRRCVNKINGGGALLETSIWKVAWRQATSK